MFVRSMKAQTRVYTGHF